MKMTMLVAVAAFLLTAVGEVASQAASPFVGTWKVVWQGPKRQLEADLVITESGGTWKTYRSADVDPCVGREVAVAIESSSATEMTLTLKFAEAMPGCRNSTVKLVKGENAVTGTRGKAELTLTKK